MRCSEIGCRENLLTDLLNDEHVADDGIIDSGLHAFDLVHPDDSYHPGIVPQRRLRLGPKGTSVDLRSESCL